MRRRSALRASGSDRELAAGRVRHATVEGRLTHQALEDRLGEVFSARTCGQLHGLVADLPAPQEHAPAIPLWARASLALAGAIGVLAAAAMAALLFAFIAGVSVAWMVFTRALSGRGERVPRTGRSRVLAGAARQPGAHTGVRRGERVPL